MQSGAERGRAAGRAGLELPQLALSSQLVSDNIKLKTAVFFMFSILVTPVSNQSQAED